MGYTTLLVIYLCILLPVIQACFFKTQDKAPSSWGSFKSRHMKTHARKLSTHPCICGEHYPGEKVEEVRNNPGDPTSYSDQKYILYINFKLSTGRERVCVGTIINSNMVITSHRCLLMGDKQPSVSEILKAKMGNNSTMAGVKDITLTSPAGQTFPVKKIIYSEHFAYNYAYESAPETDVAILIVDWDFNDPTRSNTSAPICVPSYGQIATQRLLGMMAYYQGIRTWEGSDINYYQAISNFSKIRTAEDCQIHGRLPAKPTSNDTLCLMFTFPGPTIEGGPLRIVAKRLITGEAWRNFLVGIAIWTGRNQTNARHKYAYFANINSIINYIERHALLQGSDWCPTPHPDEQYWPWEFFDGEVDRSLDCECGYQPNQTENGRIIGGELADEGEFPWLVKLFINVKLYVNDTVKSELNLCGGAHCFVWGDLIYERDDFNLHFHPDKASIHKIFLHSWFTYPAQDNLFDIKYKLVLAKKIVFHPGYVDEFRDFRYDFDIALIILNESLTFDKVENGLKKLYPICLPEPGYLGIIVGENATVSGWGSEDTNGSLPTALKKLSLPIRNQSECLIIDEKLEKTHLFPTDTRVCASYLNPTQTPGKVTLELGRPIDAQEDGRKLYPSRDSELFPERNISTTYFANVEAFLPYIYYYSKEYGARFCKRGKRA